MRRFLSKVKAAKGGQEEQQPRENNDNFSTTTVSSTALMQSFSEESAESTSTVAAHSNQVSTAPAATSSGSNEPRFKVIEWSGVAFWAWDSAVENCAICRNLIIDVCIECQPSLKQAVKEGQGVDEEGNCRIAYGVCQHVFHFHCISRWMHTRQVCPLDNRPWEFLSTQ